MQLSYAFLADDAEVESGKVFVLGGGVTVLDGTSTTVESGGGVIGIAGAKGFGGGFAGAGGGGGGAQATRKPRRHHKNSRPPRWRAGLPRRAAAADPIQVARNVTLLVEGGLSAGALDADRATPAAAGAAARVLVDAACGTPRVASP